MEFSGDLGFGLKRHRAIRFLARSVLSEVLRKGLRYASIRGRNLVFVFKHPSFKFEFEKNKVEIKRLLRESYRQDISGYKDLNIVFYDISSEILHTPRPERLEVKESKIAPYKERAKGNFNTANNRYADIFDRIKEIIKQRVANV